MKNYIIITILSIGFFMGELPAQGPPITVDNPIMLGKNNLILRNLTEFRQTELGDFTRIPVILSYLPSSDFLVGVNMPYVSYNFKEGTRGSSLGDISLFGKYQIYRNDMTAKTLRATIKTVQTLPTGENLGLPRMSTQLYQSYLGMILGYESIKFGIASELGYNWVPNGDMDELMFKLGFGLPLLAPIYPVNQINLYFEYTSIYHTTHKYLDIHYSSGIQYALGQWTIEVAFELPLKEPYVTSPRRSIYVGSSYVF